MRPGSKVISTALSALALAGGLGISNTPAQARGGDVALGVIGGLAAGALVGNALSQPRYYAPPPPPRRAYVYPAYEPVYEECVARRVWGPYGWHWVHEC